MIAAQACSGEVDLIVVPTSFDLMIAAATFEVQIAGMPALVVIETGVQGGEGPPGRQGLPGASAGLVTYVAAAMLSGDKALMFAGPGRVVHADPSAPGYVYAGIALGAAQIDDAVEVRSQGDVQTGFWVWTPDLPVFTAPGGDLTQVPPTTGRRHLIGWAIDAQTIHLDPEPPVTFV